MSLAQYSGKLLVQDGKARTGCCCTQCRPNDDCCHPYVLQNGTMPGLIQYPSLWAAYPTISSCRGFNLTCDDSSSSSSSGVPGLQGFGALGWGYRFIGAFNPSSGHGIKIDGETPTQKEVTDILDIDFTSHHQNGIGTYIQAQEVKTYKGYALLTIKEAPTSSQLWAPYIEQAALYGSYCRHYFAMPLFTDEYLQWSQDYAKAVSDLYGAGKRFIAEPGAPFLCAGGTTVPTYYQWIADKNAAKNTMALAPQTFLLAHGLNNMGLADGNCIPGTIGACTYKVTYAFQDDAATPFGEYPDSVPRDYCWTIEANKPAYYADVARMIKSQQSGAMMSYTAAIQTGFQNCQPELTVSFNDVQIDEVEGT